MARVRYLGPEPVTVPELGDRTVHPDAVIEIPDDRFDGYVCQTANWEAVEEPGAKSSKKTAARAPQKEEG